MENIEKNLFTYILIDFIETRFGDPISSLNINSNFCIIGTMLGRLILFNINTHKKTILLDGSDEEIININFSTNNNRSSNDFYCCVGDSSILKYSIKPNLMNNNNPMASQTSNIKNYPEEFMHVKDCDNAIVYMTKEIFFMIAIEQIKKKPMILNTTESNYIVKNIESQEIIEKGILRTTNYIVPFDFDGKYFVYLQFFTNVERMLCSYNVYSQKTWKHLLKLDFGILNYCKLINDNKLFIVRNLNQCEFRIMDDNFSITHTFAHNGDQVVSIDLYYKIIRKAKKEKIKSLIEQKDGKINIYKLHKEDMKKSNTDNKYRKNKNIKKFDNTSETETKKNNMNNYEGNSENLKKENLSNDLFYEKEIDESSNKSINSHNNEEDNEDNNKLKKEENIPNIKANSLLNIFLVDIDGNINYYNDIGIKTLFNVNKIKEIDKGARERGLFSLNYSYIIKYSHPYLAISTDNGCYIFQLKHI